MPAALCFDVYGTLFDTASVATRVRERLDAPAETIDGVVALWRETQLRYAYQVALMDAYRPFDAVTAAALDYAVDAHDLDLRATDRDAILAAYEALSPFDDALATLEQLAAREERLAILSNGDPDGLATLAENAGIRDRFEAIVSADEVGTFKPHPAVYENAADRLGVALEACWLVSANAWDAAGAAQAGMGAVWVNRAGDPPERVGGDPDVVVDSLDALPAALDQDD